MLSPLHADTDLRPGYLEPMTDAERAAKAMRTEGCERRMARIAQALAARIRRLVSSLALSP